MSEPKEETVAGVSFGCSCGHLGVCASCEALAALTVNSEYRSLAKQVLFGEMAKIEQVEQARAAAELMKDAAPKDLYTVRWSQPSDAHMVRMYVSYAGIDSPPAVIPEPPCCDGEHGARENHEKHYAELGVIARNLEAASADTLLYVDGIATIREHARRRGIDYERVDTSKSSPPIAVNTSFGTGTLFVVTLQQPPKK
jgi:hypothetical protein